MTAAAFLAFGITFLSGAEDAFFYESLQLTGRASEYNRLAGRVNATLLGTTARGNLASGLLATLYLQLPFIVSMLALLVMLAVILTFKEPQHSDRSGRQPRKSYATILRQSLAMMRTQLTLRDAMLYLALVPLTAVILETVFLQPQVVALGVPLAGIGVVVMAVQLINIVGSTRSHWITQRFGEGKVLYAAPLLIIFSLLLLATFQILPALLFVAGIGFVTAVIRPLVLSRIQHETPDEIRATILSMQSLLFTLFAVLIEPLLGVVADQAGFSAAYFVLVGVLTILIPCLFWKSRHRFPQAIPSSEFISG
jgi:predicted MFS family arabinose efflux permease